ncbi:Protein prune 2 [Chionoecetes opilio]|uniref:Protein prune 2 n=1 Tax=Chionoecetes opilio TaxID=41210 RepID=A0A8J4XVT8_CHIOP|nr:Protein prune 2 [Chionoecetes opilio]
MRGESNEAVVGGMGEVVRAEGVGVKGSGSPPLSAAVSQVSLAQSDLTTSDPDLVSSSAYSSAASSRPPSSSQMSLPATDLDLTPDSDSPPPSASSSRRASSSGMVTPDLRLPTPEEYTAETVEFPTSPRALKGGGRLRAGVCFLETDEVISANFLTPNYKTDESDLCDDSPKQGNGFEVSSDQEEDYFEEFHLPNSHENAFVRHKSFRRKVHLTPIDAPDAEKIEGLVRTGEFERHGSIRRKMVPEEPGILIENADNTSSLDQTGHETKSNMSHHITGPFAKDLREIESMLDDNEVGDVSDILGDLHNESDGKEAPEGGNQAATSTPKTSSTNSSSNHSDEDFSFSCREESTSDDNLSIEQSTLMKVRECMDFTKHKDVYVLSGRLQDILTPVEVEEILNNSERYSEYVNKDVIEVLHNSLQEQQSSYDSIGQFDSGISCSKKIIHAEGVDVDKAEAEDIRAVIDDSEPQSKEAETNVSKRSSCMFVDDDEEDGDTGFRFEHRRSFRLGKEGNKEVEVEGVFVESKTQDIGLKKIRAPTLDLSENVSEEPLDAPELPSDGIDHTSPEDSSRANPQTSATKNEAELPAVLPDIVVTVAGENMIDEDDESMFLPETSDITENGSYSSVVGLDSFTDCFIHAQTPILRNMLLKDDSDTFKNSIPANFKYEHDPLPPPPPQMIPELTAAEESFEERHWRNIVIGGVWHRIDMKVIAPYKKCVSHGGYLGENNNAIIVISACELPDRSRRDYNYVMDNLFFYVVATLEQLIADDYVLLYLAGGTPKSTMPSFHWLKRAYQMIDRKLRKNLKSLHVVHPTFWVRALVAFSRPFISTKFYRKLTFVNNLTELAQMVPLDQLNIPDAVKQADFEMMIREKKKNVDKRRGYSLTAR